jgi:hypothetical protein
MVFVPPSNSHRPHILEKCEELRENSISPFVLFASNISTASQKLNQVKWKIDMKERLTCELLQRFTLTHMLSPERMLAMNGMLNVCKIVLYWHGGEIK